MISKKKDAQNYQPIVVVLVGAPGSGKTTLLSYLRHHAGKQVKIVESSQVLEDNGVDISHGGYADNHRTNRLVGGKIAEHLEEGHSVIVSGYPRTVSQMEHIHNVSMIHNARCYLVYISLDEKIAKERAQGRNTERKKQGLPPRKDDDEQVLAGRFIVYNTETIPMIDFHRKQVHYHPLYEVDGRMRPEVIMGKVQEFIDSVRPQVSPVCVLK